MGLQSAPGRLASLRSRCRLREPIRDLVPGVCGPRRSVCSSAEPWGLGSPTGPWLPGPPLLSGRWGSAQGPAAWPSCLCQPSERVPGATLTPGEGGHEARSLPRAPRGSGPTTGQSGGPRAVDRRAPPPSGSCPPRPSFLPCVPVVSEDLGRGSWETDACRRWPPRRCGSGISGPGFESCVCVACRPICPKPKSHLQMGPSMCLTGRVWENRRLMISNNNNRPPGVSAQGPA